MASACIACATLEELLALKPDYLVESASPAAMRELALPALRNGTSVITLSIGALADEIFYRKVAETAKANGTRIYIASGATGGFDVLRTASLMGNTTAASSMKKVLTDSKGLPFMMILCKRSNVPFSPEVLRKLFVSFQPK